MLQAKGYTDLRASFLEILSYLCEVEGPTIKEIGVNCGLKKQTMTSHLNELESRGYIRRETSLNDKREQLVYLTDYGMRFKFALLECLNDIETNYKQIVGNVEFERIHTLLDQFYNKLYLNK